ncbi:hypothetical protein GH714_018701 [Hevea brasiliensis]|uniref:Gnk2-homologous domain-containing protein n=1 Tax=Hevea brasiliensis TaxID=3981 RepID=A0A6A6LSM5_HEVBR|nr:hypothetical protein GH714_018701 [Hevea brasiliensis]
MGLRRTRSPSSYNRLCSQGQTCRPKPLAKLIKWGRRLTTGAKSLCSAKPGSGYTPLVEEPIHEKSVTVPKGHLAIYVGQKDGDFHRVLVPVIYINHPLFGELLREAEEEYGFNQQGCSQEKYQPNSPFEGNLNSFLTSVVSSSSQASYNSFAIGNGTSTPAEATIYGLYQCRGDLKTIDCSRCMESAVNQIGLVCPYSYGAALQLEGCYVRYEHNDFLGKLDTSLRYKKCSKSVNNDAEFFRRRDDVLADLQTAMGFKVSSSGVVEGYAQCLGDINSADCSSCLADAVGMLKTLCGSAAAADVFLGQCYARYWASATMISPQV